MKKTTNKGFTLVELIIVITILAILATVAFVSFQGYAGDSRDAKRKSELGNLRDKIETNMAANSQDVLTFAVYDVDTATWVSFGWVNYGATASSNYVWGTINYATLWADSTKYTMPYRIWAVKNSWNSAYQLYSMLDDGTTIYTQWNYVQRTLSGGAVTNATITSSWTLSAQKITLSWTWVWLFKQWDAITNNNNRSWIVTSVSSDLSILTVSWTTALGFDNWTWLRLTNNESDILVNKAKLSKQ